MRIGIVTFFYRPIGGGIPRYVEDIANQFVRQGHSVDIITGAYDELNSVERHKGLTIYRLHCMNILLKSEEENIVNSKEFLKFLKKYSSKKKPDIFFAQNLHASISSIGHAFMLNIISLEKNIPLALAVHSFPTNPGKDLKLALLKNLSWGKIIPVSCALAENLHLEMFRLTVEYCSLRC
jgi:glycosyltransferase involved in cell wall biosynthesis